jgi:hypothetical protein
MKRREFITLFGGAAASWPIAARAQQSERMRRIAILSDFSELEMQPLIATFRERMQQLGWGDDSIRIDTRVGVATTQFPAASAALVGMAPDVIVTLSSPALRAMKQETRTIPIVFTFVADPVGQGLVASLAHPGGNVTGFTNFEFSFAGKWLEALKEIEAGAPFWRTFCAVLAHVSADRCFSHPQQLRRLPLRHAALDQLNRSLASEPGLGGLFRGSRPTCLGGGTAGGNFLATFWQITCHIVLDGGVRYPQQLRRLPLRHRRGNREGAEGGWWR